MNIKSASENTKAHKIKKIENAKAELKNEGKGRERVKAQQPLKIIHNNIARAEKDGQSKGKQMMVIRKDRVVEKKIEAKERNSINLNENINSSVQNDSSFLNSFVEGKSYNSINSNPLHHQNTAEIPNSNPSSKYVENIPIENEANKTEKRIKQKLYVQELEDQIKMRDKIKRDEEQKVLKKRGTIDTAKEDDFNITPQWSNINYNKSFKSNDGAEELKTEERFSNIPNGVNLSPSKSTSVNKDRNSLGSAPKAVGSVIMGYAEGTDPFGGNIPIRKKISNRIDQELESCGSVFSGRDEKGFLAYKRNMQQQHIREELLRQIEEKKKREEEHKRKIKEEDINDEFRIKKELQEIGTHNEPVSYNFNQSRGKTYQNKTSYENSLANKGYLPELITKQDDLISERIGESANNVESIRKLENNSNRLETTAAFAPPKAINGISKTNETNRPIDLNQKAFSNAVASESNKIKEMIDQCDNK